MCHVSAGCCDLWRVSAGFSYDLNGCPTPNIFCQGVIHHHQPKWSRLLNPDYWGYLWEVAVGTLTMTSISGTGCPEWIGFKHLQTIYKYKGEHIINSRTTFHHESFSCESAKKTMTRFHHSFFLSGPAWRGHAYGCQSHPTIAGTPCFFPLSPVHAQLAATLRLWSCQVATASTGPSATDCQIFPASSAQSRP